MTQPLKLAVFDMDGTLVDSQTQIHGAMCAAFEAGGLSAPTRSEVRAIIGLSLPMAFARLAPSRSKSEQDEMVAFYKSTYFSMRKTDGSASSPLYPGARELLEALAARDDILLGVATGNSRRGLDHVLEMHGIGGLFVTTQVADLHPSKPHPAMLEAAVSQAGCLASHAVMIGDTSFDLEMGRAAGTKTIGVDWGYHSRDVMEACAPDALASDTTDLATKISLLLDLSDE